MAIRPQREEHPEAPRNDTGGYGYQEHLDSHGILRDMDKLFYKLFDVWPTHKKKKKKKKVHYR